MHVWERVIGLEVTYHAFGLGFILEVVWGLSGSAPHSRGSSGGWGFLLNSMEECFIWILV